MRAGKLGGHMPGNLPAMILGSVPQMATALTRQSTSSPLGGGVGTVSIENSFGPVQDEGLHGVGDVGQGSGPGRLGGLAVAHYSAPFTGVVLTSGMLMLAAQRRACSAAARSSGSGRTSAESQPS